MSFHKGVATSNSRNALAKGELVVIVPNYRELAEGTLASILLQARLSREELERLL
jgi:hypothetical protein